MAENTIPETLNGIKVDESTLRSSNPFDKTTGVNTAAPTGGAKTDKYANNNLIKNSNIDTKDAIVPKPRKVKRRPSYIGWAIGMLLR